ncbi:MAG TPA: AraC family transcriptional regulator [Herpetosiphonaceae bacterium]|nr:AraC family transcriptional regulator [Herpetosiphonaceae bacterium]
MARETAVFWQEPALGDMELLRATYVTHTFAPHTHEGYAIGVIEQGAETFAYRREQHVAAAGSVVVIEPGEMHTGQSLTPHGWSYRMLYPPAPLLQQAAVAAFGQERGLPSFAAAVLADPHVAGLIRRLHLALEDPATSTLERESRSLWTFTHLVSRHAERQAALRPLKPEPAYVERIRRYLDEHFADSPTLEDLASLVHVSPFHLLRVFRESVGMPPHAYLNQVRVRQAQGLIVGDMPLAEVALQTGFADQSHLSRQFCRIVGVPPGRYRRAPR